jgi:hypothetical protein
VPLEYRHHLIEGLFDLGHQALTLLVEPILIPRAGEEGGANVPFQLLNAPAEGRNG